MDCRQTRKLLEVIFAILISLECFLLASATLRMHKCRNGHALPLSLTVDGCEEEPCPAINKDWIHFAIDFEAPRDTETLKAEARAYLEGAVQLPYEVPKEDVDACKFLKDASCPLKAGQKVHYDLRAPVDAPITGPVVELEFALKDDTGKSVFCIREKVKIVGKQKTN